MMGRRGFSAVGAAFAIYLIAGCAANTPAISPKDSENTQKPESRKPPQIYAGRLSLQIEPEAGSNAQAQSFAGSFELRGNADAGELDLLTPLGQIVMRLRWRPDIAEIVRDNKSQIFANAQDLIQQATGASLSLAQLFAWLEGKAQPVPSADWQADLSAHAQGRIIARRSQPTPAVLRIALESP